MLCTATQPALQQFLPEKYVARELCPRRDEQFRFFERVTYQNIDTVTEEEMAEKLQQEWHALCIVNTRKRAQRLYEQLQGEGIYHLSTTMYPAHRKRVLAEIRERLDDKKGKKCIVISTSLVGAGVDLDFTSVYRELAGVDSIIQAAGRCNRNDKRGKKRALSASSSGKTRKGYPDSGSRSTRREICWRRAEILLHWIISQNIFGDYIASRAKAWI